MSEIKSTPPTARTIKLQTSKKDKFLIVSALKFYGSITLKAKKQLYRFFIIILYQ